MSVCYAFIFSIIILFLIIIIMIIRDQNPFTFTPRAFYLVL